MYRRTFAAPQPTLESIGAMDADKIFGVRFATGALAAGAVSTVTVPLGRTLADTAYTVSGEIEGADLEFVRIVARTTTDITVGIRNSNTLATAAGTIHLIVALD